MKTRQQLCLLSVALALILSILACGGGGASPTAAPVPAQPTATAQVEQPTATPKPAEPTATERIAEPTAAEPTVATTKATPKAPQPTQSSVAAGAGCEAVKDGQLDIAYTSFYKDVDNFWRVIGLVCNKTSQAVGHVQLEVDVLGKTGKSLLDQKEKTSTSLDYLDAGEASPFALWLTQDFPQVDKVTAAIVSQEAADLKRAKLDTQGIVATLDDNGDVQISGEFINKGKDPVTIHSVAAATFDKDGKMMTADSASVYIEYLSGCADPQQCPTGPFRATLHSPAGGADVLDSYTLYYDVETTDKQDFLISAKDDLTDISAYFDGDGHFHMAGELTNSADKNVDARMLMTLYDKDGNVIDASYADAPTIAKPGETIPYEFSDWGPVNSKKTAYDSYDNWTIQIDPSWTFSTDTQLVDLAKSVKEEAPDYSDNQATFKGTVTNKSGGDLSSVIIIVGIYGKPGEKDAGQLLATGNGYADFNGTLANGKSASYTVYIPLPKDFAADKYDHKLLIKGQKP